MGCGVSAFAAVSADQLELDIPDTLPEMPVCCQGGLMLCAECAYARLKEKRSLPILCMFTGEKFHPWQRSGDCAGAVKGSWDEKNEMPYLRQPAGLQKKG